MRINTIKWRIFKYNIIVIVMFITLTTIIFNVAIRLYLEKDIVTQLHKIASNAEDTALEHGPDFFKRMPPLPPPEHDLQDNEHLPIDLQNTSDVFKYYFMLERSLKEPLTILNADFILLDQNKDRITPSPDKSNSVSADFMKQLANEISKTNKSNQEKYINFNLSNTNYIAIIKPVSDKNSFGLGWIIIYSNIKQINQLQLVINIILLLILVFSALITIVFSSRVSKKISEPFSHLNHYIRDISERNFGKKIEMPVYDELRELVNNINIMSEKLETHDKAQKTFLQNVSHEFRTPLMSIQSYAEGIKYDVVNNDIAVPIILDEIKRMTTLVEDLLYLSRLDAIEESYNYINLNFNSLINICIDRMNLIAEKSNINITTNIPKEIIQIHGDDEKLSRAITNILSNCIRYAHNAVILDLKVIDNKTVQLLISDDGPGFEVNELPNIFERFYKGAKGHCGLGLSISKNVVEKLNGKISVSNLNPGALFVIELPIIHDYK
ncbi:two-component sensor histidine kinase [Clostridium gelidum]|uniref:histidine kinase n=1 Tax=Clostridium gelidum TaxID=704125 RepID=A0ABM7TKT9_9CLOT|nr:HAMP domain-containing sensor histidine kinase [Clostridium gelidum]BCZ48848.1 two-component sensor histidine kinase [Clostridium gelidum]